MSMNDLPPEFAAALKTAGLADVFAGGTAAHRREYLQWIGEAKKPETRAARIKKIRPEACGQTEVGTKKAPPIIWSAIEIILVSIRPALSD